MSLLEAPPEEFTCFLCLSFDYLLRLAFTHCFLSGLPALLLFFSRTPHYFSTDLPALLLLSNHDHSRQTC